MLIASLNRKDEWLNSKTAKCLVAEEGFNSA